ncbi:MAG: hypothetical protein QW520_01895 [Methanomassiliicoccales archaeon]
MALELSITFDMDVFNGPYYLFGHASTDVEITYPEAIISPQQASCTPGGQVILLPEARKTPSDFKPYWHWETDANKGKLFDAGQDPSSASGSANIEKTDGSYAIFKASESAEVGSIAQVRLGVWVNDPYGTGNITQGHGMSNITIMDTPIRIVFDYQPQIDYWHENSASLSAVVSGAPAGTKRYVWNTTGLYGGFGQVWPSYQRSFISSAPFAYYSGNGNGSDGDRDVISVSV